MQSPHYDLQIFGPIPRPLGGVADFIQRLVCALDGNKILVRDMYAGEKTRLPGHVVHERLDGRSELAIGRMWASCLLSGPVAPVTFVNFSNPAGLVRIIPIKKSGRWVLMLHDGGLGTLYAKHARAVRSLIDRQLQRFDAILCISKDQMQFYRDRSIGDDRLMSVRSYVRPSNWLDLLSLRRDYIRDARPGTLVVVTSGSALPAYRLDYVLKLARKYSNPNIQYRVFIYGPRDTAHFQQLSRLAEDLPNVRLLTDCDAAEFNTALAQSDVYLRPFNRDSLGIVVADAWNLGLGVVASDCCERLGAPKLFATDDYEAFEAASNEVIAAALRERPSIGATGAWTDEKDRLRQLLLG